MIFHVLNSFAGKDKLNHLYLPIKNLIEYWLGIVNAYF